MGHTLLKLFIALVICAAYVHGATLELKGQGSSLAFPIYSNWAFEYQLVREDVRLDYVASGSGEGRAAVRDNTDHFGGSDSPRNVTDPAYFNVVDFATVSAAVVIGYNFPGVHDLILSRQVIYDIYRQVITHWNDDAILEIQVNQTARGLLANSTAEIVVGGRAEGSGTTKIFMQCLSSFSSGAWRTQYGEVDTWTTPTTEVLGAKMSLHHQNFGVTGFVSATPYSIGYIAYPTIAKEPSIKIAQMINKHGNTLKFTAESLEIAVRDANSTLSLDRRLIDSDAANGWPMGGPTFIFVRTGSTSPLSCPHQRELLLFWKWALSNPVAQARIVFDGYANLGHTIQQDSLNLIDDIKCASDGLSVAGNHSLAQHTPKGGYVTILVIVEIVGAICLGSMLVYLIRDRAKIPAPALFFFAAMFVGSLLNYVSVGWFYMIPTNRSVCLLRKWFVGIGFSLMFAAIFVRAFQIQSIILLSKSSKILSSKARQLKSLFRLIGSFAVIVAVQLILLIIWSAVDPWVPKHHQIDSLRATFTYICSSKHNWLWFGLEIAYFGMLLAFGFFVVYRSWDMKHLIVESKYLAISVYNSSVIVIIVIILFATLPSNDNLVFYVSVSAIGFLTLFSILAFILPKLLRVAGISASTGGSQNSATMNSKRGASKSNSKDA